MEKELAERKGLVDDDHQKPHSKGNAKKRFDRVDHESLIITV